MNAPQGCSLLESGKWTLIKGAITPLLKIIEKSKKGKVSLLSAIVPWVSNPSEFPKNSLVHTYSRYIDSQWSTAWIMHNIHRLSHRLSQ